MKNNLIVIVVVVGCLGFFGGIQYQKSNTRYTGLRGQFHQLGDDQDRQVDSSRANGIIRRGGMSPVSGEILSVDDKNITIKSQDGSSKIIIYTDSTSINKTLEGSLSDLLMGEEVMVVGVENANGIITAQSISIVEVEKHR